MLNDKIWEISCAYQNSFISKKIKTVSFQRRLRNYLMRSINSEHSHKRPILNNLQNPPNSSLYLSKRLYVFVWAQNLSALWRLERYFRINNFGAILILSQAMATSKEMARGVRCIFFFRSCLQSSQRAELEKKTHLNIR